MRSPGIFAGDIAPCNGRAARHVAQLLDDCVFLDADETLATSVVDGLPDERRFNDGVGGWIRRGSSDGAQRVSAIGEMVTVLCREGNTEAVMRLEQFWGNLLQHHPLNLLCAYPDDGHSQAFERICTAPPHVKPPEPVAAGIEPDAVYRTMALMQQPVNALKSELHRRQAVEHMLEAQNMRIAAMAPAHA